MKTAEFAGYFQANQERCYRVAYAHVKNEILALKIVGDAAYNGLMRLPLFRDTAKIDLWILRLVTECALNSLQQRTQRTFVPCPASDPCAASAQKSAEDFYGALDRLHGREKTYIILSYFEELSLREISWILKETEANTQAGLNHAVSNLYITQCEK